jgi:hypothetical protein
MPLYTKLKPSKEFEHLEAGSHLARCSAVIAVGLQKNANFGDKDTLYLRFEVPAERFEFTRDGIEVDEPGTIWPVHNNSHHEMAKLRQHIESWLGRSFTVEEELTGFDLSALIGQPCIINVVHKESGGKTYANVKSVSKLVKGQDAPPQELPSILFGPDDTDQYDDLPKWLQTKFDNRLPEPETPTQAAKPEPEPIAAEVVSMEGRGRATDDFENADIPF